MSISRKFDAATDPHSEIFEYAPLLVGGALALYFLTRKSKTGVAVAATGAAVAYSGMRAMRRSQSDFARSSVLISRPAAEVYSFWRSLENLPRFMHHLESVREHGNGRSEWTAAGPAGYRVSWTAEILYEREGELIAWRSVEGSEIEVNGSVEFKPYTAGRGTMVEVSLDYSAPGGRLGNIAAKLLGKDPSFLMRQDLRRLKALMETGEIATTEGQPHGQRSIVAAAARALDPDKPSAQSAGKDEAAGQSRRVS